MSYGAHHFTLQDGTQVITGTANTGTILNTATVVTSK